MKFRLSRVIALTLTAAALMAISADAQTFGLDRRMAWTTSRLVGSPEPPLPYTVEKAFAKLEFKSPLYIAEVPQSNYLLVVLQGGEVDKPSRIIQFVNDEATKDK